MASKNEAHNFGMAQLPQSPHLNPVEYREEGCAQKILSQFDRSGAFLQRIVE